jgi:murein DD-endopeptidase MepM/ murein hydrolase activator NlpD
MRSLSGNVREFVMAGVTLGASLIVASCSRDSCGPFPDWQTSPYVLPYPAGTSYFVNQANCSTGGHRGIYKHSYDFVMPIGAQVTAARAGRVEAIRMRFKNGQPGEGESNWVKIRHADGTLAAYSHLTENGALVKVGDWVVQGQPIGLSGNTGNTGGLPHLHFHVCTCSEPIDCGTLPVTFSNTDPNPKGLDAKRSYTALPFTPKEPNKAPEPTTTSVTSPAAQELRQP